MAEWKDKDIQTGDVENVKSAISGARNAAMKIGQVMYNQQSSGQQSTDNQNQNQQGGDQNNQNQSGENKQWFIKWLLFLFIFFICIIICFIC